MCLFDAKTRFVSFAVYSLRDRIDRSIKIKSTD